MRELTETETERVGGGVSLCIAPQASMINPEVSRTLHAQVRDEMAKLNHELQQSMQLGS